MQGCADVLPQGAHKRRHLLCFNPALKACDFFVDNTLGPLGLLFARSKRSRHDCREIVNIVSINSVQGVERRDLRREALQHQRRTDSPAPLAYHALKQRPIDDGLGRAGTRHDYIGLGRAIRRARRMSALQLDNDL